MNESSLVRVSKWLLSVIVVCALVGAFRSDNNNSSSESHVRTTILLFSTPDWLDMTCAAASQARRFARAQDEVIVVVTELNASMPAYKHVELPERARSNNTQFEFLYQRLQYALIWSINRTQDAGGLFMLDSDTAIFRNVFGRVVRRYGAQYDFVFQRELPCHTEHRRRCVNGGVWWMSTRSERARHVLVRALRYMHELHLPDQDALQHALAADSAVRVAFLDVKRHPNGFVYNFDGRVRAKRVHLVHVNWAPSKHAKLERLYDLGVVEEYSHCFSDTTLSMLRSNRTSSASRRRVGGVLSPVTLPIVSTEDLINGLHCERAVNSTRCVRSRAPRYTARSRARTQLRN